MTVVEIEWRSAAAPSKWSSCAANLSSLYSPSCTFIPAQQLLCYGHNKSQNASVLICLPQVVGSYEGSGAASKGREDLTGLEAAAGPLFFFWSFCGACGTALGTDACRAAHRQTVSTATQPGRCQSPASASSLVSHPHADASKGAGHPCKVPGGNISKDFHFNCSIEHEVRSLIPEHD